MNLKTQEGRAPSELDQYGDVVAWIWVNQKMIDSTKPKVSAHIPLFQYILSLLLCWLSSFEVAVLQVASIQILLLPHLGRCRFYRTPMLFPPHLLLFSIPLPDKNTSSKQT